MNRVSIAERAAFQASTSTAPTPMNLEFMSPIAVIDPAEPPAVPPYVYPRTNVNNYRQIQAYQIEVGMSILIVRNRNNDETRSVALKTVTAALSIPNKDGATTHVEIWYGNGGGKRAVGSGNAGKAFIVPYNRAIWIYQRSAAKQAPLDWELA